MGENYFSGNAKYLFVHKPLKFDPPSIYVTNNIIPQQSTHIQLIKKKEKTY